MAGTRGARFPIAEFWELNHDERSTSAVSEVLLANRVSSGCTTGKKIKNDIGFSCRSHLNELSNDLLIFREFEDILTQEAREALGGRSCWLIKDALRCDPIRLMEIASDHDACRRDKRYTPFIDKFVEGFLIEGPASVIPQRKHVSGLRVPQFELSATGSSGIVLFIGATGIDITEPPVGEDGLGLVRSKPSGHLLRRLLIILATLFLDPGYLSKHFVCRFLTNTPGGGQLEAILRINENIFVVRADLPSVVFEGAFPDHVCNKILLAKYLITYLLEVRCLVIIDTYKNGAILLKQILAEVKSWIHHIEPA